jgi:hypothetical protein
MALQMHQVPQLYGHFGQVEPRREPGLPQIVTGLVLMAGIWYGLQFISKLSTRKT